MFTELKIRNFQSLKEANIKLGKITVIIGPSFLGKSATVRSLYTLARNRFESSFMKKGTSHTSIELHEGDRWVKYDRDSSSYYTFSDVPEPYTKIGRMVPSDISDFLRMPEIVFDSDLSLDFNFQRQFDSPFILSLSGFEVAKVFGKLMNLDIVLSASREINRDIQAINKEKDKCQAIQDVSIKYIQENHSIELKYALLQEAISIDREAKELELSADNLLSDISELLLEEARIELYSELLMFLDTQGIDEMEDPPEALEALIVSGLLENSRMEYYSLLLKDEIPEFDFESLPLLEDIIVSSEIINKTYSSFSKLAKEIDNTPFDTVDSIYELNSIINRGDELNYYFLENKEALSSIEKAISEKTLAFSNYIKQNNICPLTKKPFLESCLATLEGGL